MSKTIKATFIETQERFRDAGIDTPILDARLLIQAALGITYEQLFLNNKDLVTDIQFNTLRTMIDRRIAREPVSRIVGHRAFWKYNFKISKETLDPRPDSESIILAVMNDHTAEQKLRILDLGTGTGCLILSVLGEMPKAAGVAIDMNADAIEIARENAKDIGFADRLELINTSWNDYEPQKQFDIVISNPPYIPESDIGGLEPEVRQYDPLTALVGGADGLACYREIIMKLDNFMKPTGKAYFEIGYNQAAEVTALLLQHQFKVKQVVKDLTGHDRCLVIEKDLSISKN